MDNDKRIEIAARLVGDIVVKVGVQPKEYKVNMIREAFAWADAIIEVADDSRRK